uniref:Carboxypeptidase n=1 Tax=Neogobius melanostomus TaxID=47308 RepID=A0A8C6U5L3_9GOBI
TMGRLQSTYLVALFFATLFTKGLPGPPEGKEDWGYVTVRDGAHMFWWLYYADSPSAEINVLVCPGRSGGSGTGFGNFEEIGPLDGDLQPRDTTWVQSASVLFVDNPVGTGFSYTNRPDAFATNVSTVASDMLVLLRSFFSSRDDFQTIPFYIFSESYGGKMAAAISLELTKAIAKGSIKCNFAGVALGDSWISPLDSVLTWGPYLYTTSLLDDPGLAEVNGVAQQVKAAVEQGQFLKATELWSQAENAVERNTNNVNFYNILTQDPDEKVSATPGEDFISLQWRRHLARLHKQPLSELMNGPIRKRLNVIPENVTWGGQSNEVFSNMAGDFMRPVVDIVDQLLSAGVNVTVYNGQLDLIVDTMGQELWVKRLQWEGLPYFNKLLWTPLYDPASPGLTGAFYKTYKNFSFYWILRAGHMVLSSPPIITPLVITDQ